jgi:hypothetical protein
MARYSTPSTWLASIALSTATVGCAGAPPSAPCYTIQGSSELRAADAQKTLDALGARIHLPPEDEALRHPKSLADVRSILRRDTVYLFGEAATFAHGQNSVDGRYYEATSEMLLGESQLIASQVLSMQEAWVSGDVRIARASMATDPGEMNDRSRLLAQLLAAVDEGNKIAAALAAVAPSHLARGAQAVRAMQNEAPTDPRTYVLTAEYHRLRGEWDAFDAAIATAEKGREPTAAIRYLRAMEQMERNRNAKDAASMMRDALTAYPHMVRAQAALVLMAPNPRAALRELAKLKEMNPDHYIVMLLEPTLAADQELLKVQNGADHATP